MQYKERPNISSYTPVAVFYRTDGSLQLKCVTICFSDYQETYWVRWYIKRAASCSNEEDDNTGYLTGWGLPRGKLARPRGSHRLSQSWKRSILINNVTVAGICNSVGGGVFLICHRGAGGIYRSMSRLGLLTGKGGCRGFEIRSFQLSWNALIAHGTTCNGSLSRTHCVNANFCW